MSHFLVYIPETPESRATVVDELSRVGLSDLVENASTPGGVTGPDGKTGLLVGWPKPTDSLMHYSADEQEWFPCKPCGELPEKRYWFGIWNRSPVTPKDIMRNYPRRGVNVTLGDSHDWHFPIINELPSDAVLMDDGSWKFQVQRQYAKLWCDCAEWESYIANNSEFDFGKAIEFLLRCLTINYRITPDVAEHLNLFTTENIVLGLFAVLGYDAEGNAA